MTKRSAATPARTEDPDPAQTATLVTGEAEIHSKGRTRIRPTPGYSKAVGYRLKLVNVDGEAVKGFIHLRMTGLD